MCSSDLPTDQTSRDVIAARGEQFAFCEVLRDKHQPFDRETRGAVKHSTLAHARNQILVEVNKVRPQHYISWDSDLLVAPGTVEKIAQADVPICTVWAWLNRQEPQRLRHQDADGAPMRSVLWQEPMQATAMEWAGEDRRRAQHLPGEGWDHYAAGLWQTDVVLGFQMMRPNVYMTCRYGPHADGEMDCTVGGRF